MSTFFSHTDLGTLREEGTDRNHFVSLIVNNEGTYTAAVTRKVTSSKTINNKFSYPSFNDTVISSQEEYVTESEEIEWFYLKIEFETNKDFQSALKERLKEIKTNKESKKKDTNNPLLSSNNKQKQFIFEKEDIPLISEKSKTKKEEEEEDFTYYDLEELDKVYLEYYGDIKISDYLIRELVLQLLTGSIAIANSSKIDIAKWIPTMTQLFNKRFGTEKDSMETFKSWADPYVEFLCWYTEVDSLKDKKLDNNDKASIIAYFLYKEFYYMQNKNKYIIAYMKILESYLY